MQQERRIIYIINPISGARSKERLKELVTKETQRAGIPFSWHASVANGDYSFLLKPIHEEKITDIIIIGGDGTISQVIESLKGEPVQFGIIPAGSGNGLAFGAGISKSPQKALSTIFGNRTMALDGFRVNQRFACMLCGLGFDAKIAHDFAAQSRRGLATYVQQVFKNFFLARPYPFSITLNETAFEIAAFFISIANSNQFGNHFTIAPKASLSDGLLDVVIVTEQSKISMLVNTLRQVMGANRLVRQENLNHKKSILYFQTKEIGIHNPSAAPMHIDGDPVATEKTIQVKIEEQCFKLLVNP